jgi:hypothetical protein
MDERVYFGTGLQCIIILSVALSEMNNEIQ